MNMMTNFASGAQAEEMLHLSEEQIDEQLMGDLDSAAAAHLAECTDCSRRVAEAAEPMATFLDVTIAWSERRSATMPIPVVQGDALVWQRRAGWAMTACALVIGISLTSTAGKTEEMLRASEQSAQSMETASAVTVRVASVPVSADQGAGDERATEQYSGDNQMLKAIDSELDASTETPAAMGLETVNDQPSRQNSPTSVED